MSDFVVKEAGVEDRCHKCDLVLFPGQRKYVVRVRISADPDNPVSPSRYMDGALRGVFRYSPGDPSGAELDEPVERAFVLCERCRRHYEDNPLAASLSPERAPSLLH